MRKVTYASKLCGHCGLEYNRGPNTAKSKTCSVKCARLLAYGPQTIIPHFWTLVSKTDTCWIWTSAKNEWGYGMYSRRGLKKNTRAHRFSYELVHGPIPNGMLVLHSCDTPACVRPEHLRLGTHSENIRDKMERGRHPTKLTEAQVIEIKRRAREGELYKDLASEFSMSLAQIGVIVRGQQWKHVP